jgi:8-oxo-dGTP pyrophosphatase MutT (NUDIX family)
VVIDRRAARALLLADRSVLLMKGFDPGRPQDGAWWLTPGGGVEDGEAVELAAVREVLEETGLQLEAADLGAVVATRVADFEFERRSFRQTEWFYAVRVPRFTPTSHGWEDVERRSLLELRWWNIEELRGTDETVYPVELAELVEAVLDGRLTEPMQLSGD